MTMNMNPEIRDAWTALLESGEIPQTQGALCRTRPIKEFDGSVTPEGMCCLGVLSELAVEAGVIEKMVSDDLEVARYGDEDSQSVSYLPDAVVRWAGIEFNGRYLDDKGKEQYLSAQNDEGASFKEIAEIIKKHF